MNLIDVKQVGKQLRCYDMDGNLVTGVPTSIKKRAYDKGTGLNENGGKYNIVPVESYAMFANVKGETQKLVEMVGDGADHEEVTSFIHGSYVLKPHELVMSELNWRYMVRSAVRGKNLMMVGPSGCGKTMAVKALVKSLDRPHFYFNLGATQDPRSFLIGNTHFSKEEGTYFNESTFIKAIKTPNAIILLDELSRAHPDAGNILMTVLDEGQRYLRLDEHEDSPIVNVADGVTFAATANIGTEYTGTRLMDRALRDRFVTIEMGYLDQKEEVNLLKLLYPDVDSNLIKNISKLARDTRKEIRNETGNISTAISTRATVEMTSLVYDGFTLEEACEVTVYPMFSDSGGVDSERTYVKQIAQKYIGKVDDGLDNMFSINTDEFDSDSDTHPF